MTKWIDRSDAHCRFFDGGESHAANTTQALRDLFECLQSRIIGTGAARDFDLLLFEVNCDTGRLISAATTSVQHASSVADGCSVRIKEVQDYWYDLLESGQSDAQFSAAVTQMVRELGIAFRDVFVRKLDELNLVCSPHGFTYRVFGNDPGVVVHEELFSMT
jgi:hypothetical protein